MKFGIEGVKAVDSLRSDLPTRHKFTLQQSRTPDEVRRCSIGAQVGRLGLPPPWHPSLGPPPAPHTAPPFPIQRVLLRARRRRTPSPCAPPQPPSPPAADAPYAPYALHPEGLRPPTPSTPPPPSPWAPPTRREHVRITPSAALGRGAASTGDSTSSLESFCVRSADVLYRAPPRRLRSLGSRSSVALRLASSPELAVGGPSTPPSAAPDRKARRSERAEPGCKVVSIPSQVLGDPPLRLSLRHIRCLTPREQAKLPRSAVLAARLDALPDVDYSSKYDFAPLRRAVWTPPARLAGAALGGLLPASRLALEVPPYLRDCALPLRELRRFARPWWQRITDPRADAKRTRPKGARRLLRPSPSGSSSARPSSSAAEGESEGPKDRALGSETEAESESQFRYTSSQATSARRPSLSLLSASTVAPASAALAVQ